MRTFVIKETCPAVYTREQIKLVKENLRKTENTYIVHTSKYKSNQGTCEGKLGCVYGAKALCIHETGSKRDLALHTFVS